MRWATGTGSGGSRLHDNSELEEPPAEEGIAGSLFSPLGECHQKELTDTEVGKKVKITELVGRAEQTAHYLRIHGNQFSERRKAAKMQQTHWDALRENLLECLNAC